MEQQLKRRKIDMGKKKKGAGVIFSENCGDDMSLEIENLDVEGDASAYLAKFFTQKGPVDNRSSQNTYPEKKVKTDNLYGEMLAQRIMNEADEDDAITRAATAAVHAYLGKVNGASEEEVPTENNPTTQTSQVTMRHTEKITYETVQGEDTTTKPAKERNRKFRTSVELDESQGYKRIFVHDKTGVVIAVPVADQPIGMLIDDDPTNLIMDLAAYITACMSPTAIFTSEEFSEDVMDRFTVMDESTMIFLRDAAGDYIYAYRVWSYLIDELTSIYAKLNAEGPGIFESTAAFILCALSQQMVLGFDNYRSYYSELIHDSQSEDVNREKFIEFMKISYDKGRANAPISVDDMDTFVGEIQNCAVMKHLSSSRGYDEEEMGDDEYPDPEMDAIMGVGGASNDNKPFPSELEAAGFTETNNKEVNDGRNGRENYSGEVVRDASEEIREMDAGSDLERGTDERSGGSASAVVPNPYAGDVREVGEEKEESEVRHVDGYRQNAEQLREEVKEVQIKEEEKEEERPVDGSLRNESVQVKTKEEKEEEISMVIPVRRG